LRLNKKISKPESATCKYTTIANDMKIQKLEEENKLILSENSILRNQNKILKGKIDFYMH